MSTSFHYGFNFMGVLWNVRRLLKGMDAHQMVQSRLSVSQKVIPMKGLTEKTKLSIVEWRFHEVGSQGQCQCKAFGIMRC